MKRFRHLLSINWRKTVYFNFKMFSFRNALKFPFIFYGKVKFKSLKGKIIFESPIEKGIARFGKNLELISQRSNVSELRIDGTLKVNGNFIVGNDFAIHITTNACMKISGGSYFGHRTRIICTKLIKLGQFFRFGFDSIISDSNYHFIHNTEKNTVSEKNGTIVINDNCWVGGRSTILKGTVTPTNIIIASNSLLNRDYTSDIKENSMIGGIPAKLIKTNVARIMDTKLERKIEIYFANNPNMFECKLDELI